MSIPSVVCNNSGRSESLWMDVLFPSFPVLEENLDVDVCIVGAGIVGLTCAYKLIKEGKSVVVLDKGAICGGQTARTTAHVSWILDARFFELEKLFGKEKTRLAAESHSAAIDFIEKVVNEEKLACDFERVDGYLFLSPKDSPDILEKEFAAIQEIGMACDSVPKAPLNAFDTGSCLHFPRQAQFHVLKYLQGLIQVILQNKGKIYSGTQVSEILDGLPCQTKTSSGFTIKSQSTIVATCTPINNRFMIHTKQAPYRTYVIAASIPKGAVHKALYWDTEDPYHYVRIQENQSDHLHDWLIVGGEDHKTGHDPAIEEKYDSLEQWAKERFPMIEKVVYRWSGQVFNPVDSLAYIGKNPGDKNIYIATGDSGNGITHGTIAGLLLPDLILGRSNPWESLYEPSRKTFSAAYEYVTENLDSAIQLKDWLTPGELDQVNSLPIDQGMILRKGLKKFAIYKDLDNKIHINSAKCPHLGGCVRWNDGEKSWDCPFHGARFDGCGHVLNGPAGGNLSKVKNERSLK